MSLTYSTFVSSLANMLVIPPTDANYLAAIQNIIDDAEQRLYRELDLLSTIVSDNGATTTANVKTFTLPQTFGRFVTVQAIHINNVSLLRANAGYVDAVFRSGGNASPLMYAMRTDQVVTLAPVPDQNYITSVIGTVRPAPLSVTNPTTFLTLYLPDLFLAESLIFGYGYLKDFGAATDDPRGSVTWNSHYNDLWKSANDEENRKRFGTAGWSRPEPATVAASTPP